MMDVFPTPWSPKNTNLYLAKGETLATGGTPVADDCPPDPTADVGAIINNEVYMLN